MSTRVVYQTTSMYDRLLIVVHWRQPTAGQDQSAKRIRRRNRRCTQHLSPALSTSITNADGASSSAGTMNHAEWNVVECSDEESYFEADKHYRTTAEGGRIWEPSGEDIVHLYEEIHSKGFNQLDWQCPGKLSPSQLEHLEEEPLDNNCSGLVGQTQAKSEFDFDNDFEDNTFRATATRVPKRSQGL